MRLVLHSPNTHQGGGLTLLKELIEVLPDDSYLIIDSRLPIGPEKLKRFTVYFIKPTVWHRLQAELTLRQVSGNSDLILCFGSLPPLFTPKADVTLFLQNRYFVDKDTSLEGYNPTTMAKMTLGKLWFKLCKKNISRFVVQSKCMHKLLKESTGYDAQILPYAPEHKVLSQEKNPKKEISNFEFIYVATGEPHKNHKRLVLAWVELSKSGIFPSLCLTVSRQTHLPLCNWIKAISNQYNLNIENRGTISLEDVFSLYEKTRALIFPSLLESFGLPLVEAKKVGLPILASELDYVRDVASPVETFDPKSYLSISRAVRRFLDLPELPLPILTGKQFLAKLVNNDE